MKDGLFIQASFSHSTSIQVTGSFINLSAPALTQLYDKLPFLLLVDVTEACTSAESLFLSINRLFKTNLCSLEQDLPQSCGKNVETRLFSLLP